MSNHDQWLEFQGGCYAQAPSCSKCGYELCEHGNCAYCTGCVLCDAEEEVSHGAKKSSSATPPVEKHRKAG